MTAILTFRRSGWPVLIGDILLTGIRGEGVSIPSIHLPNSIKFENATCQVAGICQKIEIITDHICIAWAGRAIEARSFIRYISDRCVGKKLEWDDFRQIISESNVEEFRELQFVAYFWTGSDFGSVDNTGSYDLADLNEIRLFGSGRETLFATLEAISTHASSGIVKGSESLQGLLFALTFAGHSVCRQMMTGEGLVDGWGGGFEIASFEKSGKFMKADRILYVFLECKELNNGVAEVVFLKPFIYQFYHGDDLIFLVNMGDPSTGNRAYLVGPFGHSPSTEVLKDLPDVI